MKYFTIPVAARAAFAAGTLWALLSPAQAITVDTAASLPAPGQYQFTGLCLDCQAKGEELTPVLAVLTITEAADFSGWRFDYRSALLPALQSLRITSYNGDSVLDGQSEMRITFDTDPTEVPASLAWTGISQTTQWSFRTGPGLATCTSTCRCRWKAPTSATGACGHRWPATRCPSPHRWRWSAWPCWPVRPPGAGPQAADPPARPRRGQAMRRRHFSARSTWRASTSRWVDQPQPVKAGEQHPLRLSCGHESSGIAVGRQVHEHDVGLRGLHADARQAGQTVGQCPGVGMVVGQPVDVVVQGVARRRSQHPHLAQPTAQHLADAPGTVDQRHIAHQGRAHRRPQPLAEAHRHAVVTAGNGAGQLARIATLGLGHGPPRH